MAEITLKEKIEILILISQNEGLENDTRHEARKKLSEFVKELELC